MWPPQKLKGYLSDLLLFFWLLFVRKRASVLVRSRMGLKVTTRNQPCCNFSDRNLVRQKSLSSSSSTNLDDCNFTPIELLNHHDFLLSKFNELNRGVISLYNHLMVPMVLFKWLTDAFPLLHSTSCFFFGFIHSLSLSIYPCMRDCVYMFRLVLILWSLLTKQRPFKDAL